MQSKKGYNVVVAIIIGIESVSRRPQTFVKHFTIARLRIWGCDEEIYGLWQIYVSFVRLQRSVWIEKVEIKIVGLRKIIAKIISFIVWKIPIKQLVTLYKKNLKIRNLKFLPIKKNLFRYVIEHFQQNSWQHYAKVLLLIINVDRHNKGD